MSIIIAILAIIGCLGLYSRLQDIEALKTRAEESEKRVTELESRVKHLEKIAGVGNTTAENMESL